jgi:superkiller protein 3
MGCSRSPVDLFRVGTEQYQQGDYTAAATSFAKVTAKTAGTPQLHTLLGVCRLHQGKTEPAVRSFRDALKLDPTYLPARYNLALAQLELGQNDLAATELQQLCTRPGYPAGGNVHLAIAHNNRAVIAARQRDIKRAEQYLQLALAADPRLPAAARNLAALRLTSSTPPHAAPTLTVPTPTTTVAAVTPPTPAPPVTQTVIAPPPVPVPPPVIRRVPAAPRQLRSGNRYSAKNLFNEAVKLHQQGKLPNAIELYNRAITTDPTYAQAYYNRAIAYRDGRQVDLAFESYELALMADPAFQSARYNYAILLQNQGYITDALEQYERVLRETPTDASIHLTAAQLYVRNPATHLQARQHYEAYLKLSPNSAISRDIRTWLDQNP